MKTRLASIALLTTILFGCMRSAPTRYYLLSAATDLQPLAPATDFKPVVLRQLRLPEYLDRAEIVRRRPQNELGLSDHHLWGEKLSGATASVLERNLARLLGDERVVLTRQYGDIADCRALIVVLHQFDAGENGVLTVSGRCDLESKSGSEPSFLHRFDFSEPLADDSVGALVNAYNAAMAELARQIAGALLAP